MRSKVRINPSPLTPNFSRRGPNMARLIKDTVLRGKPSYFDPEWVKKYRDWWNGCIEAERREKEKMLFDKMEKEGSIR